VVIPFDPAVTEYELQVPYDVEKLTLSWETADETATVTCSDTRLTAGETTVITVTVQGTDGRQTVYTLTVYRGKQPASSQPDSSGAPLQTPSSSGLAWIPVLLLALGGIGILVFLMISRKKRIRKDA
jgi:hypothetical protein